MIVMLFSNFVLHLFLYMYDSESVRSKHVAFIEQQNILFSSKSSCVVYFVLVVLYT